MQKKNYPQYDNYDELELLDSEPKQILNRSQSVTLDTRPSQPYRNNYRNITDDDHENWMRYHDEYSWDDPTISEHMSPIPKRRIDDITNKEISLKKKEKELLTSELNSLNTKINEIKIDNNTKIEKTKKIKQKIVDKQGEWEKERKSILSAYNGKIPPEITELDKLRKGVNDLKKKNTAFKTSLSISEEHWSKSLKKIESQLKEEKIITELTYNHNKKLSKKVDELKQEKIIVNNELNEKKKLSNNNNNEYYNRYPPESTVIQNLLQAQVEYYFSDYNLKRDKKLLNDVCKIPKGFLRIKQVMHLSRIRQLCSETSQLVDALKRSKILTLKKLGDCQDYVDNIAKNKEGGTAGGKVDDDDDVVDSNDDDLYESSVDDKDKDDKTQLVIGRESFSKPKEKEFPFRRTVFAFGIKQSCTEDELKKILSPFGQVVKIQFDSGNESVERKIGSRFLTKPRIYELYRPANIEKILSHLKLNDNNINNNKNKKQSLPSGLYELDYKLDDINKQMIPIKMDFLTQHKLGNENQNIKCHKCNKMKPVAEGFYTSKEWKNIFCSQCGAQLAEEQLNQYYKDKTYPKKKWLGEIPKDFNKRKTALVVFASQRQASKCAYVRTRIAYDGVFATHFHHYSKIKKEIEFNVENNDNNENKKKSSQINMERSNYQMRNNKNKYNNNSGKRHIRNLQLPPGTSFIRQSTAPLNYNDYRGRGRGGRNRNNRGRGRGRGRGRINNRFPNNRGRGNHMGPNGPIFNNNPYPINMNKPIPMQQPPRVPMIIRNQVPIPKMNKKGLLFRQKSAPVTKS